MKKSKWAIIAAVFALVAGAGWYFGSPAFTLNQMKAAAEANDSDKLVSYIDFPSLREDLKAEFMAHLMAESAKDNSGFGALGMALGSAMVGPMIDGMVTPAGVRAAIIANRNKDQSKEAAPDGGTTSNLPKEAKSSLGGVALREDPVIKHRGFSKFIVASKGDPHSGMVFKRHGFGWKLSGVDLPAQLEAN